MDSKSPSVYEIEQRIRDRLVTLGNKTRSKKATDDESLRAAHGARELSKLLEWIKRNKTASEPVTPT